MPSPSRRPPAIAFRRVLVPLDGSALGHAVLPYAAALARAYRAELLLVHVVSVSVPVFYGVGLDAACDAAFPEGLERARRDADALLDAARRELLEGGDVDVRVLRVDRLGVHVTQAIADAVEREDVDLVVMSTHGRGGLAHLLMGSVAEAVLCRVRVPVCLVRVVAADAPASLAPPVRPADGS